MTRNWISRFAMNGPTFGMIGDVVERVAEVFLRALPGGKRHPVQQLLGTGGVMVGQLAISSVQFSFGGLKPAEKVVSLPPKLSSQ